MNSFSWMCAAYVVVAVATVAGVVWSEWRKERAFRQFMH